MSAHFLCRTTSLQSFPPETSIANSISQYFLLYGQERTRSIYVFSLRFLSGICFGNGFHLCGGDAEPGLICAFYLNSMSTWLSMKQRQIILGVKKALPLLSSIGRHEFDCSSIMYVVFRDVSVGCSMHHFGPDRSISATTGWIVMKLCTDILSAVLTYYTCKTNHIPLSLSRTLC